MTNPVEAIGFQPNPERSFSLPALVVSPDHKLAIQRRGFSKVLFTPRPISLDRVGGVTLQPDLGRNRPFGLVLNGGYLPSPSRGGLTSHLVATILTRLGVTFYDVNLLGSDEQKDNTVEVRLKRGFYRRWVLNVDDAQETIARITAELDQERQQ